jgi:hypothetical protein
LNELLMNSTSEKSFGQEFKQLELFIL